jgi:hypothetical protein
MVVHREHLLRCVLRAGWPAPSLGMQLFDVVVDVTVRPGRRAYSADARVLVYTAYPSLENVNAPGWSAGTTTRRSLNFTHRNGSRAPPPALFLSRLRRAEILTLLAGAEGQRLFIPPGSVPKPRLLTASAPTSCPSSLTHPHPTALLRQRLCSPRLSILAPQRTATSRIPCPQPLTVARSF